MPAMPSSEPRPEGRGPAFERGEGPRGTPVRGLPAAVRIGQGAITPRRIKQSVNGDGAWKNPFAVGMTIADHPPHRSVLAPLEHTAPTLDPGVESNARIGMYNRRRRQPLLEDRD